MNFLFWPKMFLGKNEKFVKSTYAFFSIFRVFFSHQHIQMITGPHEKSGVEKFFGDPFLQKLIFKKLCVDVNF